VTEVASATIPGVTVNVAVVAPAATVTFAGTLAALGFELASETTTPPVGAAALSVTVPVAGSPPGIELGLTATLFNEYATGSTVKLTLFDTLE